MVNFPTPAEVADMQSKDQKKVVLLVDRFVEFLRPTLESSRPDGFGETHVHVPAGLLQPGEKWNWNHNEELRKRIGDAGWQIVDNRLDIGEAVTRGNFRLKPRPTT